MVSLNARKLAIYIQLTGILSVVALVAVAVSFGTQHWIHAIAIPNKGGGSVSSINYGLFSGTLIRSPLSSSYVYDIYITCIWGENSCAWSCADSADSREAEVQHLVDGEKPTFSCIAKRSNTNSKTVSSLASEEVQSERIFTNAGLWLSTILALVVLLLALLGGIVLSAINCMRSPIETFLNVQGIYVANAVALVANFFVLLLYGICYESFIDKDVAIYDTLVGDYRSEAWLGYSYWIFHLPLVLQAVGIFLIVRRERILSSDRAETTIDVATDVPGSGVLF